MGGGYLNVSRYKRRDTEKRVNKNVQMSDLCHSALDNGFSRGRKITKMKSENGIPKKVTKLNIR